MEIYFMIYFIVLFFKFYIILLSFKTKIKVKRLRSISLMGTLEHLFCIHPNLKKKWSESSDFFFSQSLSLSQGTNWASILPFLSSRHTRSLNNIIKLHHHGLKKLSPFNLTTITRTEQRHIVPKYLHEV